jgi:hypothetical protein
MFLATRDSSYIINTIIDADQKDTVVAFQNGETSQAELAGFTITNGLSSATVTSGGLIGGGIYCTNASPYLHHLIVEGNLSELDGGGMYLERSNSLIEYCVIRNNRGVIGGGGLYLYQGNNRIMNCTINDNKGRGAGIYCVNSKINLFRILLFHNLDSEAIWASSSFVNLINCTVTNHYSDTFAIVSSDVNIINSIIWNDSPQIIITDQVPKYPASHVTIAYSDIKNGLNSINNWAIINGRVFWREGNIENDPEFQINYSLTSLSPCIDAGSPFYQIGDSVIVNIKKEEFKGKVPDIGAIESNYNSTLVNDNNVIGLYLSNFPNPFNSTTAINYSFSKPSHVSLTIYTITGQIAIELFNKYLPVGNYHTQWSGTDKNGNKLSSGVYVVRLNADNRYISKPIIFLK